MQKGRLIEILSYKGLTFDSQFQNRQGFASVLRSAHNADNKEVVTVQVFSDPDEKPVYRNFVLEELEYE